MRCANHLNAMTGVTCSQCGKPICPSCQVETEAGVLCRQCYRKDWRSRINRRQLLKIAFIGFITALVCGMLWGVLDVLLGIFPGMLVRQMISKGSSHSALAFLGVLLGLSYTLLLAIGAGYVIGATISIKTKVEYGWQLVLFTSLGIVVSYAIAILLARYPFDQVHFIRLPADLAAVGVGVFITYRRLQKAEI